MEHRLSLVTWASLTSDRRSLAMPGPSTLPPWTSTNGRHHAVLQEGNTCGLHRIRTSRGPFRLDLAKSPHRDVNHLVPVHWGAARSH